MILRTILRTILAIGAGAMGEAPATSGTDIADK